MLQHIIRIFRRPTKPIQLGRWSTYEPKRVVDKRAEMADHDSCGAKDCATPTHLSDVDENDEWYHVIITAYTRNVRILFTHYYYQHNIHDPRVEKRSSYGRF